MKILVIGCGRFGSAIIENMLSEGHDVVVVDASTNNIENINNTLDVLAICGNGADYKVLEEVGMKSVDVCVSCTASDEINILSCIMAKQMGARHTIVTIRNQSPDRAFVSFLREKLNIDLVISPNYRTAQAAHKILKSKGVNKVIILGATAIAKYLTRMLVEDGINVKIMDRSEEKCREISEAFPNDVLVLNSDGAQTASLLEAGLESTDALVAMTTMDEENIMTSLFAIEHKVPTIITKIEKTSYTEIVHNLDLKHVVAPRTSTVHIVVDYVRGLKK